MRKLIHSLVFVICLATSLVYAAGTGLGAGLRLVELNDPVAQKVMKAAIFYPTEENSGFTKMGPLEIAAMKDAPVRRGRYPLVLLSHGNGGSMFSHQDIASALANTVSWSQQSSTQATTFETKVALEPTVYSLDAICS